MNRYIENLKSFLAEQPSNFRFDDANSILELLCDYYCSANPVDNAVSDLCLSYERQAFLDGLTAGMRLFSELGADN